MYGQPPSYDDLGGTSYDSRGNLVVRLEVWHFSECGRLAEHNIGLANAFAAERLENWTVRAVDVANPHGPSNSDKFVPVQVDFEYNDDDSEDGAENDVRQLFRHIAPAIIFLFFLEIQSKPHAMSLIPRNAPYPHQHRYRQLFIINKLNTLYAQAFLKPAELEDVDAIAALISTTDDRLSALSHVVEIFTVYQLLRDPNSPQFAFIHAQDANRVLNVQATVFENIESLVAIVETMRQSYEAKINHAADDEPAKLHEWKFAIAPHKQFATEFAGVVSSLEKIKKGEVSYQELYETSMNLDVGIAQLSEARGLLEPYLRSQVTQYKSDMLQPKNIRLGSGVAAVAGSGTGGAILAGILASNPLCLAVCGILFVGGAIVAGAAQSGINQTSEKIQAIEKFKQDLKDLADVFNETRNHLAVIVSRDVFSTELDSLGSIPKKAILKSFGVDVNALEHKKYCESLVESGIDKVMDYYKSMIVDFQDMMEKCGLDVEAA